MALIQIDHDSDKVGVNLPLNLILPDDLTRGGKPLEERKVLYLLHGLSDDASAWQRYTNIEILARAHGLVVVMPTAGRSFYANMANGQAYFSYITEELPAWLAAIFRISSARENTYIAGPRWAATARSRRLFCDRTSTRLPAASRVCWRSMRFWHRRTRLKTRH